MMNDPKSVCRVDESTCIPAGHRHPGILERVMTEGQGGEYRGESDVARFDHRYART